MNDKLIELVDVDSEPTLRALLAPGVARYGQVLEAWRALAHHPALLEQYFPFMFAGFGPGPLDQQTKLLVALRTAVRNRCRYTTSHRWHAAKSAGLDDDVLIDMAQGRGASMTPRLLDACDLVEVVVAEPLQAQIGDGLRDRLRTGFSDAETFDLVFTASLWTALSRLHRTLGLDLDLPPAPPSVDAIFLPD